MHPGELAAAPEGSTQRSCASSTSGHWVMHPGGGGEGGRAGEGGEAIGRGEGGGRIGDPRGLDLGLDGFGGGE